MREYEFTFVVQPEISDEGIQAISERFEGLLAERGAEKLFYEDWGRRRLAYEIKNFQKGHYQVLHFLSDGTAIGELERSARLDDAVLRFLTVLANPEVADVEARRAEATELEDQRRKRAAEKAERDAEDAARAAEEAARAAEEAAQRPEPAEASEADAAPAEAGGDPSPEAPEDAAEAKPAAKAEPAAAADAGPAAAAEAAADAEPAAAAEPAADAEPAAKEQEPA